MPASLPGRFRFAGVTCGIKASGKSDLALIAGDGPLVAAGVYTRNQVVAAPVLLCRSRTPSAAVRAVVVNSGNANACTGQQGMRDAEAMAQQVADGLGCAAADVLVMSTGVIGQPLPMEKIRPGIDQAVQRLAGDRWSFNDAATAILTTDAGRKTIVREIEIDKASYRVAAMAKGAGMIAPNMATMLAVIATDAPLAPDDAATMLSGIAKVSFNRASVDGHTSTNDSLVLLASGTAAPLAGAARQMLQEALSDVCIELAKQLVADGEGATHVIEIRVRGATNHDDADQIARVVGESLLVKTAITGGDPNWGRIVSAAGYAGPPIEPERTSLAILDTPIYRDAVPLAFDAAALSRRMKAAELVTLELVVGVGPGSAVRWSSDLTVDYVQFNSEYTT